MTKANYEHTLSGTRLEPHPGDRGVISECRLARRLGGSVAGAREALMRHGTRGDVRVDEAFALLALQGIIASGEDVSHAVQAVVRSWPEIARAILQAAGRRAPGRSGGHGLWLIQAAGCPYFREGDGRFPDPVGEPIDCDEMIATVRSLTDPASMACGLDALEARFGWDRIEFHPGGDYTRGVRERCFLEVAPGSERVREVVHDHENDQWDDRSRWMLRYLLEPPPVDRWLHQTGLKEFPRLRDHLWSMAKQREMVEIMTHPEVYEVRIENATEPGELETIAQRL